MSTSVNTIKKLLWVLAGVLILTYLISLNMENHFIALNAKWISNDFLFAIAGGAFASLVIVLVCELIRYRQLKFATETSILVSFSNLYGRFLIIRSNCKRVLDSTDIVSDDLIQPICYEAIKITDAINEIDYTLLYKTNKVRDLLSQFKTSNYLAIKNILINFIFLKIAINEDKRVLIQQRKPEIVQSGCSNTNKALNKVVSQSTTILTFLNQIITQIDNDLGGKYQWQYKKQTVNAYEDNYIGPGLDDYLKEDIVFF